MRIRKVTALVLTLVLLVLSLSACGKKESSKDNTTNAKKEEAASTEGTSTGETLADPALTDPFGKYQDTVTIRIGAGLDPNTKFPEGQTLEDNEYLDIIKDTFNVQIVYDWISSTNDLEQKVNLSIASNTLPDLMNVTATQYRTMLKYDQLQPLTEAFNNCASDMLKSFVESGGQALQDLITVDGEMMAIPAPQPIAGSVSTMWIRQDWLDALGLDAPKTIADLEKVSEAFVTQDPDGNGKKDTIGIVGPANYQKLAGVGGSQFYLDPIFGAFGSYPRIYIKDDNGNLTYGSIMPETKDALAELAKMYQNGLIDPEMLVRNDSTEPVRAGKAGIFFGPWWSGYTFQDTLFESGMDWMAYAAPLDSEGNFVSKMAAPTQQYIVATKGCKNPEVAAKLINLLLCDEQIWNESGLRERLSTSEVYPLYNVYDNANEIEFSYDVLKKYLRDEITIEDIDFSTHKLLKNDMEVIKLLKKEPLDDFRTRYWDLEHEKAQANMGRMLSIMVGERPLVEDGYVPIYNLYYGNTDTMSSKGSTLEKLEDETFAKIIMGQASIDSFDAFVKDWLALGGQDILDEIAGIISE